MAEINSYDKSSQECGGTGKGAFRFSCAQDLFLLREVIACNPFADTRKWEQVAENLATHMSVTKRCCRDRTNTLIKTFIREDKKNLNKSGTEEEITEKISLLQELVDLQKEAEASKSCANERNRIEAMKEKAIVAEIREASMSGKGRPHSSSSCDSVNSDSPPTKKTKRDSIIELISKKQDRENELQEAQLKLKAEELELQRSRAAIDSQKVEIEARRLEMDRDERRRDRDVLLQLIGMLANK